MTRLSDADGFWAALDALVASHAVVIDRPRGGSHPRYPLMRYPLDYGFLDGTRASDGGGLDVWIGSSGGTTVVGLVCTVDPVKGDAEMKVLLGCTDAEIGTIARFHAEYGMPCVLVERSPGTA